MAHLYSQDSVAEGDRFLLHLPPNSRHVQNEHEVITSSKVAKKTSQELKPKGKGMPHFLVEHIFGHLDPINWTQLAGGHSG